MSPSLPTGTVAFLFTDIQGSTPLWERDPDGMRESLARHNDALHAAVVAHGGHVYKTIGDAFQAAFVSTAQAVLAALAAQRGLAAQVWGRTGPLRVRMGVHVGPADAEGADYATAHTLNRVARIMSAAHGGQVLISAEAAAEARSGRSAEITLRDLGRHRMKGLTQLEHLFQVVVPDLPSDFPRLNTLDVAPSNLPTQLTSLIGREPEIAAINRLLAASRLVTLTGSGGCGKTRLSIQVGAELQADYPHGVWLVEFAPLADPALVPQTVIATLGLRDAAGRPELDVLTDFLRDRTALLILDNCEHLIEAIARLAEALLQACPRVRCLASTREALGIPGETPYRVPSLAVPDPGRGASLTELQQVAAIRLFVERAVAARPDFSLTAENAPAVAQICRRLDGIPLALELAAARVKVLSAEQIAARLDDRFRLLTGGSRTALPRQQTLQALINWSYGLLSAPEQKLFRRLAVFAGGWTLEAAESVCAGDEIAPDKVLGLLARLVDKSLVIANEEAGAVRYGRLETIRHYARERLLESGEAETLRARHLAHYLQWAERARPELLGSQPGLWARRLNQELENIHAALAWSLDNDLEAGLRLAGALDRYWIVYSSVRDGVDWLARLLSRSSGSVPTAVRARALLAHGNLLTWHGDFPQALALAEESLALYRLLGDRLGEASCLHLLAVVASLHDDHSAGVRPAQESVAMFRAAGDRLGLAAVLADLGGFIDKDDYTQARAYLDESLALYREIGNLAEGAYRMRQAGRLAVWHCDFVRARPLLEEALKIQGQLDIQMTDDTLADLGRLVFHEGDYEQARAYLEESLAQSEACGRMLTAVWARAKLAYVAVRQGDLARARALFEQSQQDFRQRDSLIGVVYCVEGLASLAVNENQPLRAVHLFAWADAMRERIGDRRPPVEQADVDRDLSVVRAQLDSDSVLAAGASGRAMTVEQAMAYASER